MDGASERACTRQRSGQVRFRGEVLLGDSVCRHPADRVVLGDGHDDDVPVLKAGARRWPRHGDKPPLEEQRIARSPR